MSTITATDSHEFQAPASKPTGVGTVRIWPAVVLVVAFWTFLYANHAMELSAQARFVSRMVGYLIALLAFFGWWLSRSKVSWRDRLLAIAVVIWFGISARLVADKTMNGFALTLSSFPIVITVWTAWLFISRSFRPTVQRVGFCIAMFLTFAYFTLIRWDGLDAMQTAEMNWRWTPTKEQQFLTAHGAKAANANGDVKSWA